MTPETVDRLKRFNEPEHGALHRLRLEFESSDSTHTYAIILLNDDGLALQQHVDLLVGCTFAEVPCGAPLNAVLRSHGLSAPFPLTLEPEEGQNLSAWTLLADNGDLVISLHSVPSKVSRTTRLPAAIGIIVTGKQHFANAKIVAAAMLPKDVPTPFIIDPWGDSYNDQFSLEPRIIESVPQTVFTAVEGILAAGKRAFAASDYEAAATKYRKAFHYCHKYYPETLEPFELKVAGDLKLRSLLNLSLAALRAGSRLWLERAIEAANFVLEMPEAADTDRAKAYNRRGRAKLALGDDEAAQFDLKISLTIQEDEITKLALHDCESARQKRLAQLRSRLHKAFA